MHSVDSQYQTQALRAVQTLMQGSGGVFSRIPESYANHLAHNYCDGDISLLSKINTFEFSEDLEDWQIEEAIHSLAKVDVDEWPDPKDISAINLDAVYHNVESNIEETEDFAEVSDLEYGNKVGRLLKSAIESVFGQEVDAVGTSRGEGPSKNNRYCKDGDCFKGSFTHDKKQFKFEFACDDNNEWHLAYELTKASRDKLFKPSADTKIRKKK